MNKLVLASLASITVLALATPVLAYQGDPSKVGPNYTPERHELMEQIFARGDYAAWLGQMEGRGWRLKEVVNNATTFRAYASAHTAGTAALTQWRNR